jgi:hypothetical protein
LLFLRAKGGEGGLRDDEADFHLVIVKKIAIFGLFAKFQKLPPDE